MDKQQSAGVHVDDVLDEFMVHECNFCKHITLDLSCSEAIEQDQIFILAPNRSMERAASKSGCPIFRFAAYGSHNQYSQDDFDDHSLYQDYRLVLGFAKGWPSAGIGYISSYWTKFDDNHFDDSLPFLPQPRGQYAVLPAKNDDDVARIIRRRLPQRVVDSPMMIERMQSWIQHCNDNHDCFRSTRKTWLPTRLIEVADDGGWLSARVWETTSDRQVKYAALSYAWGYNGLLQRYLDRNVPTIKPYTDIPLRTMPQTLVDAFRLVLQLDLRYIWIDCLCIRQNDEEDKTREIGTMAKIFESAYMVLSAASADSSDKGFVKPRDLDPELQRCVRLPVKLPQDKTGNAYLFTPELSYSAKQEPLNHRAWTLQETLLAPRKLVFNSRSVNWSCKELPSDQEWALWQPAWQPQSKALPHFQDTTGAILTGNYFEQAIASIVANRTDLLANSKALKSLWQAIVMDYTNRDLSEASDRAIAISGIVERLSHVSEDRYLAGIWQSQLPEALFRQTRPADSPWARIYAHERMPGPTWSWMAIDARVQTVFHGSHLDVVETLAEVIGCETVPVSTSAPYGTTKYGTIKVNSYTEEMFCTPLDKVIQWFDASGHDRYIDSHFDALVSDIQGLPLGVDIPSPKVNIRASRSNEDQQDTGYESESPHMFGDSPVLEETSSRELAKTSGIKVEFLYLFACRSSKTEESCCDGLILLDTKDGYHRRLGTFSNRFSRVVDEVAYRGLRSLVTKEVVLV